MGETNSFENIQIFNYSLKIPELTPTLCIYFWTNTPLGEYLLHRTQLKPTSSFAPSGCLKRESHICVNVSKTKQDFSNGMKM